MYNEYAFDDIVVGMKADFDIEISASMLDKFKEISGDYNPLHNDKEYANSLGYPDRVAYGMLTASFISTIAGVYLPGKYSLIHREEMNFMKPVLVGDKLNVSGEVVGRDDKFKVITIKIVISNQKGEKIALGKVVTGVTK
jgi:3-hydroxybutyryl-CoA dehydratase